LNFRQALMMKEHRTNQTDPSDNTSEIKWWGFGLNLIRNTDSPGWGVFVWFYSDCPLDCWYNIYVISQDMFCDSVLGIVTCCGMYCPEIELRIAARFSAPVQTDPVAHPASCTWGKKVNESRNRPSVVQRVPGGLGSQIFMTFGTWRRWGRQPNALAAFTSRNCSWYSFSLGAESIPGPWYGHKEICHWKIQWHHRDPYSGISFLGMKRPTSGLVHPPLLARRLKEDYRYISTKALCLHGLSYGELYLYFSYHFLTDYSKFITNHTI
jgi:hypothetical protein